MPLFNYDQDVGLANTLSRISSATGINNLVKGSNIRLIAEASVGDVAIVLDNQKSVLQQIYTATATDTFLEVKAADEGLSRNILDKLILFADDQAVRIEVLTQGKKFGDFLGISDLVINSEDVIATISNQYNVISIATVNLNPQDSATWISVRIEPSDTFQVTASIFSINEAQAIPLSTIGSIGAKTTGFQLRFTKPVTVETANETDDQLRQRVIQAKSGPSKGTIDGLSLLLEEIPELLGYSIKQNTRNDNSIDFTIVTKSYVDGTLFSFIPLYITNLAKTYFSIGTDIEVIFPDRLEIYVEFITGTTEVVPDATIMDVIQSIVNTNYTYSQENTIVKVNLEAAVKLQLPDLKYFKINKLSGLDVNLEEFVLTSNDDLVIPDSYYAQIGVISNITKIVNV